MRFHSKYHSKNHHTLPSAGYPDSASDPIASQSNPFKGDFNITGNLIAASASFSSAISSLDVDILNVNDGAPTLTVGTLTLTSGFASNTDGSNLINVDANQLGGYELSSFELLTNKNVNGGYLGIDSSGNAARNLVNLTLSSLNSVAVGNYLLTDNLSSTVAPLITSDNAYGYELPSEFLPLNVPQTDTDVVSSTPFTATHTTNLLKVYPDLAGADTYIFLPKASDVGDGWAIKVKNISSDTYATVLTSNYGDKIDDEFFERLTLNKEAVFLVSDGSNYNLMYPRRYSGWGEYGDDYYLSSNPFAADAETTYELPINSQDNNTGYMPFDVDKFYESTRLNYDAETSAFTEGETLSSASGTATITHVEDNGTTGTLYLADVTGTFANDETIVDSATGSATADGDLIQGGITGRKGESASVTVEFKCVPTSPNTSYIDVWFDIGGSVGKIYERTIAFPKGLGEIRNIVLTTTIFMLDTFEANNGCIKFKAKNTIDIYDARIIVARHHAT